MQFAPNLGRTLEDRRSSSASTTSIATDQQRFRRRRSVQIAPHAGGPWTSHHQETKDGSVASSVPPAQLLLACSVGVLDLASLSPRQHRKKMAGQKKAHGKGRTKVTRTNRPGAGAASPRHRRSPARVAGRQEGETIKFYPCRPACVSHTTPTGLVSGQRGRSRRNRKQISGRSLARTLTDVPVYLTRPDQTKPPVV
jgi:hypothetical protein